MQSGSDSVLRRMRRRWGSRRFIDRCRLVQERLDRPAITTDIIVGFPGETDAEFAETIATSRAVGFSKIHIFPFSPRRGTPAATMPNQVPKHVQQERSRELAEVETETARLSTIAACSDAGSACLSEIKSDQGACGLALPAAMRRWSLPLARRSEGRFVDVDRRRVCDDRLSAARVRHSSDTAKSGRLFGQPSDRYNRAFDF